jgi:hypothetical protein
MGTILIIVVVILLLGGGGGYYGYRRYRGAGLEGHSGLDTDHPSRALVLRRPAYQPPLI